MATLFLKTGEPGKQEKRYMDKAAVRKFLERKDEKIKYYTDEMYHLEGLLKVSTLKVKRLKILLAISGVIHIGYAVLRCIL